MTERLDPYELIADDDLDPDLLIGALCDELADALHRDLAPPEPRTAMREE